MAKAGVAAPGPHIQEVIVPPTAGGMHVAKVVWVAAEQAAKAIVPPAAPPVALFMFWVRTVITPSVAMGVTANPEVVTVATNLVPEAAVTCSQPQPLARMTVPELAD